MNQPAVIDSLSAFLKWGPTGLAGLMLLLTIIGLSVSNISNARERLLKQFMYVGSGCFALALAASFFALASTYPLYFRVIPLDVGANNTLPPPIIRINNNRLDKNMTYLIKSEVTAVVDVTDAMSFVSEYRTQGTRMRLALEQVSSGVDSVVTDLQSVPQILDRNCSGGRSGVPAASNPAVIAITSKAASTISALRAASADAIRVPPPEL